MTASPPATHHADAEHVLEDLAGRITALSRYAALLDSLGGRKEAAKARADAADIAHLLVALLRSEGDLPPVPPSVAHPP